MKKFLPVVILLPLFIILFVVFQIPFIWILIIYLLLSAIGVGAYSAIKNATYDENLRPLNCPKCHEAGTYRVAEENQDAMKYRRKCPSCGFEESFDFMKDGE